MADKIALAKKRGASYNRFAIGAKKKNKVDMPTKVVSAVATSLFPDFNVLNRAARDPIGTVKGAVEIASVLSPAANAYRGYKALSGNGFSVTGADMQDIEQAVETAGIIPTGKGVTIPAKFATKTLPKGMRMARPVLNSFIGGF